MAQYGDTAIIPLEDVRRDYFSHLTVEKMLRKVGSGELPLPVVRIKRSPKSARSAHLQELVDHLDKRRAAVLKEHAQLHGTS